MQRNHNHISDLTLSYRYNLNTVTKVGQKRVGFLQPDKNVNYQNQLEQLQPRGRKKKTMKEKRGRRDKIGNLQHPWNMHVV